MGAFLTSHGGTAIQMINKTGAASVKGMLVAAGSVDCSCKQITKDIPNPIGAMLSEGIADGGQVWVVISGVAEVLLEDSTAATAGYWAKVSENQNGRIDCTNQLPEGGTIAAINDHMKECGHCLESAAAGTDVLVKICMHFN